MKPLSSRSRRSFVGLAPALWLGASRVLAAQPGAYPSKPIKLLMPTPPGSTFDTIARAASVEAERKLGQPIVAEYKTGAGGTPAFLQAKAAAPDGYTLVVVSLSTIRQPLLENVGYDGAKDFTFIAALFDVNFGILVPQNSPLRTWDDLLVYGRSRPEAISYGAPAGLGNSGHLFVEEVAARAKVQWTPIPYRGSSDCMTALLSGQLTFSADTLVSAAPQISAGRVRLLAVATDQRVRAWPDVPTMRELGYSVSIDAPVGIGGPAGMSASVVTTVQEAYRFATEQASFSAVLAQSSQRPHYRGAAEFTAFAVKAEHEQSALLSKYGLARKR